MLWYKAWLETRWRFYIGLIVLAAIAILTALTQPLVLKLIPSFQGVQGKFGEELRAAFNLMRDYRSYIWMQWWAKNLVQAWTVLAVLIAAGGLVTETSRGCALFTLALPVTRRRLLWVRAALGALETAVLALVPSLVIPAISPLIGQSYWRVDLLLHPLFLVGGGMVFFSFTFLLSTVFTDQLKPIVIAVGLAAFLGVLWMAIRDLAPYSLFKVMSAESYFYRGVLPWKGLIISLAMSAAMFYASFRIVERRDF